MMGGMVFQSIYWVIVAFIAIHGKQFSHLSCWNSSFFFRPSQVENEQFFSRINSE